MNRAALTRSFVKALPLFIIAVLLATSAAGGRNVAAAPQDQDEATCDPAKLEALEAKLTEAKAAWGKDRSSEAAQAAYEAALADYEAYAAVCAEAWRAKLKATSGPLLLATGGPDGFGYIYIDSNEPGGPTFSWEDISGTGTPLTPITPDYVGWGPLDDVAWNRSIGFAFNFYGTNYIQVAVSSNGYLNFDSGGGDFDPDDFDNDCPIPHTHRPNTAIYGFWDDLDPGEGGEIYVETRGVAPNRRFIVQYQNVMFYDGDEGPVTFQIILFEGSNDILVQYQDVDNDDRSSGSKATEGIEAPGGTDGLQYENCDTAQLTNGLAVLFGAHTLTVNKAGTGTGTVTSYPAGINCGADCTGHYAGTITLTAHPDADSAFTGWSGDCSGSDPTTTVTMDADKTCTATFTSYTLIVTVNTDGSATGTVTSAPAGINCGGDCTENYAPGTVVTLTAYPGVKSYVEWSEDCVSTGALTAQVTMDANKTCTATFGYPVGGIVVPVDKLGLVALRLVSEATSGQAPWVGLVGLAGLAVLGVVVVRRRRG